MSSDLNGNKDNKAEESELDPGLFPGLEDVPQEYRQHIDPVLVELNKNATHKINEYSEKVKAWEPYEELGVNQLEPETVGQLMGLLEMMGKAEEDPTELKQWYDELGQHFNLAAEPESEEEDFGLGEDENLTKEDIAELVAEAVQQSIQPFAQQQENRAEEDAVAEADTVLSGELSSIGEEWKVEITPEMEEAICTFALKHEGEGAVLKGAQEYKDMIENAEGNIFDQVSTGKPEVPVSPGTPNTQPEAIKTFADAKVAVEHALEQSANS